MSSARAVSGSITLSGRVPSCSSRRLKLFTAFVKCLGIYPLGTLVRLRSERLAVVVGQAPGKPLTSPTVRIFFSIRAGTCIAPTVINLAAPGCQGRIVSTESAAQWGLQDIDRYWAGELAVASLE